ncbi:MAG: DUF885 family protein [Thermodesulfobacteriota bacterium]
MDTNRPDTGQPRLKETLASIAENIFDDLGKTFPLSCWSDEFHYFPQIVPPQGLPDGWDDFTQEKIADLAARLASAERAIESIAREAEALDTLIDTLIDAHTLARTLRTLREQLVDVRFHQRQPTFHLTLLCTALAAALGEADRRAWITRTASLPAFLQQAQHILTDMPELFRDLGLEMIRDLLAWLRSLDMEQKDLAPVCRAIERFADFLKRAPTTGDDLLSPEIVGRIVGEHLGCGVGIDGVRESLIEEIDATGRIMAEQRASLPPGCGPSSATPEETPFAQSAEGMLEMYRKEADRLLAHCLARGIVPQELPTISPLGVSLLPAYLRTIRAASAYSFTPAHPTQKGTFFIVPSDGPWSDNREELAEYRMLTAHETYPGHHLLDTYRWHVVPALRRPLENPLFYEGWACFAEELMRMTGYFSAPADRNLLAKRRYRRAIRGLVDLDLQTGRLDLRSAARRLIEAGFAPDAAASIVPKYALRPGIQVCYTFGFKRFTDLFRRYGRQDAKGFAREVLSRGEIGFDLLEQHLHRRCGQS